MLASSAASDTVAITPATLSAGAASPMSFIASDPGTGGGVAASSALGPVIAGVAPDLVNAFVGGALQQPAVSGASQPEPPPVGTPTPVVDTNQSVPPVIGGPHG